MIEVTPVPGTNIVEIEFAGSVTAEEFDAVLEQFEQLIRTHGTLRVLERVGDLDVPPIPWSRFWDDVKFGFEHLRDITHAAVVADQKWIAAWVRVLDPLLKAEIRMFGTDELDAAREWLHAA